MPEINKDQKDEFQIRTTSLMSAQHTVSRKSDCDSSVRPQAQRLISDRSDGEKILRINLEDKIGWLGRTRSKLERSTSSKPQENGAC